VTALRHHLFAMLAPTSVSSMSRGVHCWRSDRTFRLGHTAEERYRARHILNEPERLFAGSQLRDGQGEARRTVRHPLNARAVQLSRRNPTGSFQRRGCRRTPVDSVLRSPSRQCPRTPGRATQRPRGTCPCRLQWPASPSSVRTRRDATPSRAAPRSHCVSTVAAGNRRIRPRFYGIVRAPTHVKRKVTCHASLPDLCALDHRHAAPL
jgi:hypothetical protein